MKKYQKDSLGNRMKGYESTTKTKLMENMPIIIRLDGCGFSKYTENMVKPFDDGLIKAFEETCLFLASNIPGVKYVYHQSDEISLLIRNDDNIHTQAWFGNDLQKLVSVTASMTAAKFNEAMQKSATKPEKLAFFDSRVFLLPETEVHNYFLWRQQDCMRNAISMVAQSLFPHKELQNKSTLQLLDLMKEKKSVDFYETFPIYKQRGESYEKQQMLFHTDTFGRDLDEPITRNYWVMNESMPSLRETKDVFKKYLK